jgi:CubicO group peptidase (beta-lactamase class C family)
MALFKVPGVGIAVIDHGKIDWAHGYGVLEAGKERPVSASSLFQAASISKSVAAMGAMVLVHEGKLGLDEPVNQKLHSWKIPETDATKAKPITLRMLLGHTAGLNVHGFPGYAAGSPIPTLTQVLDGAPPANTPAIRVEFKPGTKYEYSGGGYCVVQQLIEDISGKPFAEFMREQVLEKIGMKESAYDQPIPSSLEGAAAIGHLATWAAVPGRWHVYPERAAAGLWTTPTDLASFAIEIGRTASGKSHRVLNARRAKEMLTAGLGNYGLGLLLTKKGAAGFTHNGGNEGYRCVMLALLESGQGAVIMTNSDIGDALFGEILQSIGKTYGWPYHEF